MIEVEEATARILDAVRAGGAAPVPLAQAVGCFARETILAVQSIPGSDQSAVDGYAVGRACAKPGAEFSVVGTVPAGSVCRDGIGSGEAMRVFTGAPVPNGAAAVVMQEDVRVCAEGERVVVDDEIQPGGWIRRAGSALCAGQRIVGNGERVTAAVIGLVASQGRNELVVGCRPRVSLISTGDELVQAGEAYGDAQAFDSNGPMLGALCRQIGLGEVEATVVRDGLEETVAEIERASERSDLVVLTGGVSVGKFDFVKPALAEAGFSTDFWRVNMKPGKPFLFARRERDGVVALALPGNPVSAFVTFSLFGIPAIRRWMGARVEDCNLGVLRSTLVTGVSNLGDRPHYLRGVVGRKGFTPCGIRESHALRSVVGANALMRLEPDESLDAGTGVSLIALPAL